MRVLSFVCLLLAGGCSWITGEDGTAVELTVEGAEYRAGESVVPTLHNREDRSVGHNLCFSTLESYASERWRKVEGHGFTCAAVMFGLPPGDSHTTLYPLSGALSPGRYRIKARVELKSTREGVDVASRAFEVVD